ncbi:MAG: hypothetical protein M3019_12130, partial [Candidatus Dormibacteraeota bacterium]|nr:hypothetical protein [Candidatus Dormibacteraeota bacterium]
LAIRTFRHAPGSGTKVVVALLAILTLNGMFIDNFDWSRRGVSSLESSAYFGPGFYIGLGCGGVLAVAALIAWRARS